MDKRGLAEALGLEVMKDTIATMIDVQPITVVGQKKYMEKARKEKAKVDEAHKKIL